MKGLDAAVFPAIEGKMAFTTDSFVVKPLFFSGGNIGKLAVCGTINDLVVSGAKPLYLSAGFIIEEHISISEGVKVVNQLLGLDPLYMACEGRMVLVVKESRRKRYWT